MTVSHIYNTVQAVRIHPHKLQLYRIKALQSVITQQL